jgi:hypothetical protein
VWIYPNLGGTTDRFVRPKRVYRLGRFYFIFTIIFNGGVYEIRKISW